MQSSQSWVLSLRSLPLRQRLLAIWLKLGVRSEVHPLVSCTNSNID